MDRRLDQTRSLKRVDRELEAGARAHYDDPAYYTRQDVERFLARVKDHLAPRGAFALDVSVPSAEEMARDPNRAYVCPRFRYPATGDMIHYTERFDYDQARQILFVTMEFEPKGK